MLKKEFLKELEDRLQMLNEKERKDMREAGLDIHNISVCAWKVE